MAAIEKTNGDVRSQVELLVRHLVSGGTFGPTTFPTSDDITKAIDTTASEILAWFGAAGYAINTDSWSDEAKEFVSWYNALGAGHRIELAHTGATFTPNAKTRGEAYQSYYLELKHALEADQSFIEIGIPRDATAVVQASYSGDSKDDKEALAQDTDKVKPFFRRDMLTDKARTVTLETLEELAGR